jgi:hypothetical protein
MKKVIILITLVFCSLAIHAQTMDWIKYIKSGGKFRVSMGKDIGTIAKNKAYVVSYNNETGEFTATGFNSGKNAVITVTYVGGNIDNSVFNIWGAVFVFDGAGNVYHTSGLAGSMVKIE